MRLCIVSSILDFLSLFAHVKPEEEEESDPFQVQHTVEIHQQKIKFNAATGFTVRILYDVGKFFSAAYPPPSVLFHAIV